MKVRLITGRVGDGFAQEAGCVIDLPDREAKRLIAAEQAEPAGPERATSAPAENAMAKR